MKRNENNRGPVIGVRIISVSVFILFILISHNCDGSDNHIDKALKELNGEQYDGFNYGNIINDVYNNKFQSISDNIVRINRDIENNHNGLKASVEGEIAIDNAIKGPRSIGSAANITETINVEIEENTWIAGDSDNDGTVGFMDYLALKYSSGSKKGDENYNKYLDANLDGVIDGTDLGVFNTNFGNNRDPQYTVERIVREEIGPSIMDIRVANDPFYSKTVFDTRRSIIDSAYNANGKAGFEDELSIFENKLAFKYDPYATDNSSERSKLESSMKIDLKSDYDIYNKERCDDGSIVEWIYIELRDLDNKDVLDKAIREAAEAAITDNDAIEDSTYREFEKILEFMNKSEMKTGNIPESFYDAMVKSLETLIKEQGHIYNNYLDITESAYAYLAKILFVDATRDPLPKNYQNVMDMTIREKRKILVDKVLEDIKKKEAVILTRNEQNALNMDQRVLRPIRTTYMDEVTDAFKQFIGEFKESVKEMPAMVIMHDSNE